MRNFFERQDEARRNTAKLVALFVLAVVSIIAGIYAAVVLALGWMGGHVDPIQVELLLIVAAGTLALVGVGSLVKILSLRSGGHVVAESLGGDKLDRPGDTLPEQRLLNVVEEMAIASGTPVPPVYVLEEDGINAFAAGFTPDDAVIGVTRGCVKLLDREELQGVIAHEFSHILNEDMRLNIRLMGLLHGILLVGLTGRLLVRSMFYSGRSRKGGRGRAAIAVVGLALLIAGFAGVFCGRLIKAAVSRQREFLADASAVQFTRNPEGIGGALKKIGGHVEGARIEADAAEQASHLFFGYALGEGFFSTSWLSTHPTLGARIERIDPSFDGEFPTVESHRLDEAEEAGVSELHAGTSAAAEPTPDTRMVLEQAGTVNPSQVEEGQRRRAEEPDSLRAAVQEPLGAVAVVYSFLLDDDEHRRERQLRLMRYFETEPVAEETERWYREASRVERPKRLALVDLAAPALRELSVDQQERVRDTVRALAEADDHLSVFEYALETIVRHRLEHVAHPTARRVQFRRFSQIEDDVVTLLSALASAGHDSVEAGHAAFHQGVDAFGERAEGAELNPVSVAPEALNDALDRLAGTSPQLKQEVLSACANCVLSDETVTTEESELVRAVSIALNVPLPPRLGEREEAVAPPA